MINLDKNQGPRPTCCLTSSVLPEYIDHDQIPEKKRPFSTTLDRTFNHTLTLLLPSALAEGFNAKLQDSVGVLQYAKVYMKPSELIEGDFFNHYIKSGNILMLSAGRPGLDNVYSLCEGILRLEVDKATYQRMTLDGTAIPNGGRKHVKTRYAIELNLRLPSMVHGKHGFERIVWAFENVLDQSVTWLFYNLNSKNDGSGPIAQHQPKIKTVEPHIEPLNDIYVPEPGQDIREDDHHLANDLLEWLSLAAMGSPRIHRLDKIDTHLSGYQIPDAADMACSTQDIIRYRWHGLLPAMFIKNIVSASLKASGTEWFGLNVVGFDGRAYSILQRKHHTLTWEYAD